MGLRYSDEDLMEIMSNTRCQRSVENEGSSSDIEQQEEAEDEDEGGDDEQNEGSGYTLRRICFRIIWRVSVGFGRTAFELFQQVLNESFFSTDWRTQ